MAMTMFSTVLPGPTPIALSGSGHSRVVVIAVFKLPQAIAIAVDEAGELARLLLGATQQRRAQGQHENVRP